MKTKQIWKVIFFNSEIDLIKGKTTTKCFNTFESALECYNFKSIAHLGSVKFCHPNQ